MLKEKRHKGVIFWSKNEDGTNVWVFKFRDGITYDKLENDKYITFKVVKKEEIYGKDEQNEIQVWNPRRSIST